MKSNKEIAELILKQTRRFGNWRISPIYVGRMNKTTLGCVTGSGKQGPVVYWRKWGVYYDVDKHVNSASPISDFPTLKAARAFIKARFNPLQAV